MMSSTEETLIGGRYRPLRELQRSQGSTLWEAQDDPELTLVHLRLLDDNLRDEPLVAMRFRREYALAHRLEHPALLRPKTLIDGAHLALIYDHPGQETLADRLQRQGSLSPAELTTLIAPILQGLHHAHRHGVIHRNISPEQIWIDQDGQPRLAGFGAARVLDMVRLTTQSIAFGVGPFTAPELLIGAGNDDPRADLWSIGALLLHALLGHDAAPQLHTLSPQKLLGPLASDEIGQAICAALIKNRQERVQSAQELHDLLIGAEKLRPLNTPPQSAPCWSCQKPRLIGLKYCYFCGEGPLIRRPGIGTRSVVIPRAVLSKPGFSRWVGSLFFRRYQAQLTPKQQALLIERLHMAGFELDEKDTPRAVDLPLRVASRLTRNDAARLTFFLQRQQVLQNKELQKLNLRGEPAYRHGDDLPLLYQHRWGTIFAPWEQQTWSAKGNRFGSPLLFFILLYLGWLTSTCGGLHLGFELLERTMPLVRLLLVASISLSFALTLISLRLRNIRPLIKKTGLELLSKEETLEWSQITEQLSAPDQHLLQELFHKSLAHIHRAPLGIGRRRRLQQIQTLLGDMRDEFEILAQSPTQQSWNTLQAKVERARRHNKANNPKRLARLARLMQRQELARARSALAISRIRELMQLLDVDDAGGDGASNESTAALEIGPAIDELRALHQSFLEVEDRPRFDDLALAPDHLSLPVALPERFDVIRKLASGGQAQILAAYDHLRQESVALKILHAHRLNDPDEADALRREFAALKAVNHPNVVAAHELLELDQGPVLVLELCQGVDLKTMIDISGALPPRELDAIAMSALRGLSAIHRQGLIHGDIKPANLMIDAHNQVKIIDLGLSQRPYQRKKPGSPQGTPAYAAPEVLAQRPLDESADLYAFARTLLEARHGELSQEFDPSALPKTPLWKAIARCHSQDPTHRPQNAHAVHESLLNGSKIPSLPAPSPDHATALCHRCQTPTIASLTRCLECGASAQRLHSAKGFRARQVVLLSSGKGRLAIPRLTLSQEQLSNTLAALESFAELDLTQNAPLSLQKTPVILTSPLQKKSALLVRDELRARGLNAYAMPAHLGPRLSYLIRQALNLAIQTTPLLALLPLLTIFLFQLTEWEVKQSLLIGFTLLALSSLLLLWKTPRPAATLKPLDKEDPLSSSHAPWAARHQTLFSSAQSARTKALLRELAIEAGSARSSLANEEAAEPVLAQLDQTIDAALTKAEELILAEETILDFGDDDEATKAYQSATEKSTQILEVIQELRAH